MSVLLRRPQPAASLQGHCRVSYLKSTIFSRSVANTAAAAEDSSTTPARGFQARDSLQDVKVRQLVEVYRNYGHYGASIDPLGCHVARNASEHKLTLQHHGLEMEDLDKTFTLDSKLLPHFGGIENRTATLRDIVKACRDTYCGTYSVEYSHVEDPEQRAWLRERIETPVPYCFSKEEKAKLLEDLLYAGGFERLLASKFPTEKRYGLDGAESLAPCVAAVIDQSAEAHGVGHVIAGTCHRGRVALAGVVYGKPFEALFAEFMGSSGWGLNPESSGDVKTHLGNEGKYITGNGQEVGVSLIANPSHLESATPVAQGSAHATQRLAGGKRSVLNLALHGDAAFSGQGVVYESLNLARLPSYDVGGTVRILVNNQIGFTTNPESSRSTTYCSDVAKILCAPIFHVNSDSVEDVVFLARLAADWRANFKTDCVIDFVCYRRFGHNEMDQPRFTQPLLYERIAKHDTSEEIYMRKLVSEGTFTQKEIDAKKASVRDNLNAKFNLAKDFTPKPLKNPKGWDTLPSLQEQRSSLFNEASTAINSEQMALIGDVMTKCPDNFRLHKNLERILKARKAGFDSGSLDWTAAEASAFGSLLMEGHHVRVLGEDVQRGTFSQRHAVFHDQDNGATWTPLANLSPSQAPFWIQNSPLSEYGALGFEYGVTIADPNSLVMWEAQFGDFANTAQVIIDNFIANAETKWQDRSGLVLSLPHGLDGQGPEHSSGRIERFLMLTNEDGRQWPNERRQHQDCNFQVAYPTTPANYFHLLRRQMKRDYRKPLAIFFSKSLLRSPLTRSPLCDFTGESKFCPVIADVSETSDESIKKVMICTGQVYAALQRYRAAHGIDDVAITRVEELSPFPFGQLKDNIDKYRNAQQVVWVQEEHYNSGAWHHVRDCIGTVLKHSKYHSSCALQYAGRKVSATTAAGSKKAHAAEEEALLVEAFSN